MTIDLSERWWVGWINNEWYRCSGDMVCAVCHQEYRRHPAYPLARWLNLLCNGDLVKL